MSSPAHIDIKAKHRIVCRVRWRGVRTRLSNQNWNYMFWLELEGSGNQTSEIVGWLCCLYRMLASCHDVEPLQICIVVLCDGITMHCISLFFDYWLLVIRASKVSACDPNGKSDPYCIVYLGSTEPSHKTEVKSATLDPVWNETFSFQGKHLSQFVTVSG